MSLSKKKWIAADQPCAEMDTPAKTNMEPKNDGFSGNLLF